MEMTKVGIVMPTINLWAKYTRPALDSVAEAISKAIEYDIACDIILVDNGSSDETKTEAPKYFTERWNEETAKLSYHRNEERWGFQRSVNFGANEFFDKRKYDYVLVLNNDIVLHKNAIWRLVERFKKGGVSMATCLDITGESGGAQHTNKVSDVDKEKCPETPNPCFSAFMVNKECWEKAGQFDEAFFPAYFEDNDYHHRMQLAGLLAVTYPPAMFFHYASRTALEGTPEVANATKHAAFENCRATYVRKWGGHPGHEQFKTPYNAPGQTITSVKQTA